MGNSRIRAVFWIALPIQGHMGNPTWGLPHNFPEQGKFWDHHSQLRVILLTAGTALSRGANWTNLCLVKVNHSILVVVGRQQCDCVRLEHTRRGRGRPGRRDKGVLPPWNGIANSTWACSDPEMGFETDVTLNWEGNSKTTLIWEFPYNLS